MSINLIIIKKMLNNFFKIALILLVIGSCHTEEKEQISPRLIFNCDGTDLLGNFMFGERPLSLADVRAYVDAYAKTPITTFMMCSGSDFLYYRSDYARILGQDPDGLAAGMFSDPSNLERYYRNFLLVEQEGADVIAAVLQRAQEHQLETFISYRMNDLHFCVPEQTPKGYSDFWMNHPEYRIGENYGWNAQGAFDFAHPEVRKHKMNIISEQLDKYGHLIDGFDLDFMRMPAYFKQSESLQNVPLMTELVRSVRQKIDETSDRTGRKIRLSVRVWVDVAQSLQNGLDVKEWVRLGLVDIVHVGVYWNGHPAMPVAKFRHDLKNDQIPVCATIDDGGFWPREPYSHGQRRGMAAHVYAQGASGIYLFNHFIGGGYDGKSPADGQSLRTVRPILDELGNPEMLSRRNKIFALDDGAASAYGYVSETPLPLTVTPSARSIAELYVADNVQKIKPQEAILFLRTDRPESLAVSVNETELKEQKPEYITWLDRGNNLRNTETVYAFHVPVSALKQAFNRISIASAGGEVTIMRIEIALKYGDPTTHGYF